MTNTITSLFALYLIGNLTCLIYLHALLISFLRVILCCSYPHFNCFHELLLILFNYLMLIRLFITSFMIISWWFFFSYILCGHWIMWGEKKRRKWRQKETRVGFLRNRCLNLLSSSSCSYISPHSCQHLPSKTRHVIARTKGWVSST